jgi:hypothetical protein
MRPAQSHARPRAHLPPLATPMWWRRRHNNRHPTVVMAPSSPSTLIVTLTPCAPRPYLPSLALALATHVRPTRRRPPHGLHMSTRPSPLRLSLPRRRARNAAMTIATAPSLWRRRYHPLSPSRSLRAHPVLALPPRALTTCTRAARRHPPHGAPAQPNECPRARPSSCSQRRHRDDCSCTIAVVPSSPPTLTVAPTPPWPWPHPTSPPVVHPGMPALPALTHALVTTRPYRRAPRPPLPSHSQHRRGDDDATTIAPHDRRVVVVTTHPHHHAHFTHIPPRPSSHPALALTPPPLTTLTWWLSLTLAVTYTCWPLLLAPYGPPRMPPSPARATPQPSLHIRKLPNTVTSRHIYFKNGHMFLVLFLCFLPRFHIICM